MNISRETPVQTRRRLQKVIERSEFEVVDGTYAFVEFPINDFPKQVDSSALAVIHGKETWSQLVKSEDTARELFTVFSFHFPIGLDNSGFVGWLASHLKARLGTGVFVVCGNDDRRGGIYDYWGCPVSVGKSAIAEIEQLRRGAGGHGRGDMEPLCRV